jgi:hypothetical protein
MPRHPFGNTLPEAATIFAANTVRLGVKLLAREPRFTLREPDLTPPFHADNDACYLCNPVDLVRFFRTRGCEVSRRSPPGRGTATWLLAGGTWIAARKAR